MELVYDSDPFVKISAIELVLSNLDLFFEETRKTRLMNLSLELLSSLNEEVNKKVSFYLGKMIKDVNSRFFRFFLKFLLARPYPQRNSLFNSDHFLYIQGVLLE